MGKKPALYARAYAESLGCFELGDTSDQVLDKLRALPVQKLQSNFNIAGSWADMVSTAEFEIRKVRRQGREGFETHFLKLIFWFCFSVT